MSSSPVILCLLGLLVSLASAAPAPRDASAEFRDNLGQFALRYETETGINVEGQGALVRNSDGSGNVLVQRGKYSYISPEGVPVEVTYTADEKGFVPISKNIPVQVLPIHHQPQQPAAAPVPVSLVQQVHHVPVPVQQIPVYFQQQPIYVQQPYYVKHR